MGKPIEIIEFAGPAFAWCWGWGSKPSSAFTQQPEFSVLIPRQVVYNPHL